MNNTNIRCLGISILLLLNLSCSDSNQRLRGGQDSLQLIKSSLSYILHQKKLPVQYYNQPLQVVQPFNMDLKPFIINNRQCIILPKGTNVIKIIAKQPIFDPVPIVEFKILRMEEEKGKVEVTFRSTGHNFSLQLKKDSKGQILVTGIKEATL